jgi:hypothetical protein
VSNQPAFEAQLVAPEHQPYQSRDIAFKYLVANFNLVRDQDTPHDEQRVQDQPNQ